MMRRLLTNLRLRLARLLRLRSRISNYEPLTVPGNTAYKYDEGTWYRSAYSGLWYQNCNAMGDCDAVRVNGVLYIRAGDQQDKPRCHFMH